MHDDKLLNTYIEDTRPRFEDMLGQAVEIPSVSMDPVHASPLRSNTASYGALHGVGTFHSVMRSVFGSNMPMLSP